MWKKEVEEIETRKKLAYELGGEKGVTRQHGQGKMTVRERIDLLFDPGSFMETGVMAGKAKYINNNQDLEKLIPCPIVMGKGKINGRKVIVQGDDFTIRGASVGRLFKAKLAYNGKMAHELRLPLVRLLDGAGGTIREVADIGYLELPIVNDVATGMLADLMSEVPMVSVVLGPVSGLGALLTVEAHFSIMVKEKSQVFVGGPPLVEWAQGQKVTKEELGGYKIHTRMSNVVDNEAESEEDAIDQAKKFLDYLPSNVWEMPQRKYADKDDIDRREEELLSIIPKNGKKTYDMRRVMECIFDRDSIFEIGKYQGRSQITSLARLNGYPVGVLANDIRFKAGSFSWDVAEKFQRFIDMCDTFHLPIVNLVDQPGFFIGVESEECGTIRKGVRASFSVIQATVPWASIYVRKCFGVAGGAQSDPAKLNWRYAWPSSYWGNIPIEGGVYAAHRAEIESSENPVELHDQLQEYYRGFAQPFRAAEHFGIEDIIDPRETRPLLCDWVETVFDHEKSNLGVKKRGMRC
ncbi:MAG: carboxyl transferase domain-containing protein [Thermodesulfobacteriota bacterium]|nr:carboxyl transferase domain-containing protein [Thermodesulfobacteriota bacterium]